ncbi:MAG TPA: ATP-binding protein [Bacillota bacterium]|nr:ATP-binding protein [Bacillota bacterium]
MCWNLVAHLAACDWIKSSQNVLISGCMGAGKTIIACAHTPTLLILHRVLRLISELAIARGDRPCWSDSPRYVCLS